MLMKTRATYDDLMRVEGKAELIDGEIVEIERTGSKPNRVGFKIAIALYPYETSTKSGRVYVDGIAYRVNLSHRQSFSPDVSFFTGVESEMKFLTGAPDCAVEVRSENDYGETAEVKMAEKRADYFTAGTKAVWDVDILGEVVVRKYTAERPDDPTEYRRGEIADAEPALPGWTMPVNAIFP